MDNTTAKEILSAYRPNGADAQDENFHPALDQCRHDPTMHEWFVEEQRFDAEAIAALSSVPVPQAGKEYLLQGNTLTDKPPSISRSPEEMETPARPWFKWLIGGSIAALFVLGSVFWKSIPNASTPPLEASTFSVAKLVNEAMPLSYRSDDPAEIMSWLSSRNAPVPVNLPPGLADASALGCRMFEAPNGGEISLLCLLMNGEVVHFFVFDEAAAPLLADTPVDTWWREQGWNIYSSTRDDQRIVLATQGITDFI